MRRTPLLGAAASLFVLFGGAACSSGDDETKADVIEQIAATMQGDGADGYDAETAECFAEIVVDEVGLDRLKEVDLSADTPEGELEDLISAAAVRASDECDLSGHGG